ncbi:MAG TPA: substrate-binding domain-containing protein [Conexibacter sp.]|jgi:ABC-type sugar transport system substrate-binding protein
MGLMSTGPARASRRSVAVVAAAVASAALLSACGAEKISASGSTTDGAGSTDTSASGASDKWAVQLRDGSTFHLAPSIAKRVEANEPVGYLFSYQSSAIQGFSEQFKAGFERTQPEAKQIYPGMQFTALAPSVNPGDVQQQISQIQAQVNAGKVDCLSLNPLTGDGYTQITNELLARGIPVFTVGITTQGNELTNFTQIPLKEGAQAATTVLQYMRDNNLDFKTFAMSAGDPTLSWAPQRAEGFQRAILEAIPDARFVTTPRSLLNVSYDAARSLDAYKAFFAGKGKDVQVLLNVDITAGYAAQALDQAGLKGRAFSVGWNVTPEQIQAIRDGTQIALFDQKWWQQGGFGGPACATFLKTGRVLPNTQRLEVVTKANVDSALADLDRILGKG